MTEKGLYHCDCHLIGNMLTKVGVTLHFKLFGLTGLYLQIFEEQF